VRSAGDVLLDGVVGTIPQEAPVAAESGVWEVEEKVGRQTLRRLETSVVIRVYRTHLWAVEALASQAVGQPVEG
jgi:hypothetical protein